MPKFNFLKAASPLALAAAVAVTGAYVPAPAQADEIRFSWWGGQLRNQKTDEILQLFESENEGVSVIREQSDWLPHWDKLKIQAAAGNQPCTIQMQTRWLSTYADPSILLPLDDLVESGELDVSGIAPATINSSRGDDGNLYMIPTGVFYFALMYNKSMLEEAGVDAPADDWTWSDFSAWLKELGDKLPDDVNVTHNMGGEPDAFVTWVQSHGHKMFDQGEITFPEEVTASWFAYWEDLREAGLTDSPEEMIADDGSLIEESNIANGRTFMTNRPPNRFASHQRVLTAVRPGEELAIHPYPRNDDGTTGMDLGANGIAIGATCPEDKIDTAAAWINFFTQDPRAAAIYESDNGVVTVAALQEDQLSNPDTSMGQKEFIRLYQRVVDGAKPINYPPQGYGAVDEALQRAYESVAFGQLSPEQAATQFHLDMEELLD